MSSVLRRPANSHDHAVNLTVIYLSNPRPYDKTPNFPHCTCRRLQQRTDTQQYGGEQKQNHKNALKAHLGK